MARENDADWHAKKGENQMKKILDIITDEMKKAFAANGYDENFAKVTLSNRPDLCPTARISANTSATARWQPQRHIKRNRSISRTV